MSILIKNLKNMKQDSMQTKKITLFLLTIILSITCRADEGMWLPFMLENNIINKMQDAGLKLSAEEIYSINQACLTNAVVGFGNEKTPFRHFCTGGVISAQGLIITNHHCGYDFIQKHSTLQNDYLADGFLAESFDEELTNTGLTVSFLRSMEDVTSQAIAGVTEIMTQHERDSVIKINIKAIETKAEAGTHLHAKVNEYYYGNEFYLSIYEIFKDIRLVMAPPSAIGKFGGDTDNWTWPRHTGDFAIFRIYANPENKPAAYAPENRPMTTNKFFEINGKNISENDFTFVIGYPARTEEYLPSMAIAFQQNVQNPIKIHLRNIRIETMKSYMNIDRSVRIQYSSKTVGASNAWKKWIGEKMGIDRFGVINKKMEIEKQFEAFAATNEKYKSILPKYAEIYNKLSEISPIVEYYTEGLLSFEIVQLARMLNKYAANNYSPSAEEKEALIKQINDFYKDYYIPIDKTILKKIIAEFDEKIAVEYQPEYFVTLKKKFKGDFDKMAEWLYTASFLSDSAKTKTFVENYTTKNAKQLQKDPVHQLTLSIISTFGNLILPQYTNLYKELPELNRLFMEGLRQMQNNRIFYPDANSTFRIAFGKIKGFEPFDGAVYSYETTLKGMIEKENPEIYDYIVPDKLKHLYNTSDFGKYTNKDGQIPVCFSATNHTTGGNSGSPILDEYGRLVGLNFDRAWEGVMSDYSYQPEICRNVSLDMRYVLFILDKYTNAQNLLNELIVYYTQK